MSCSFVEPVQGTNPGTETAVMMLPPCFYPVTRHQRQFKFTVPQALPRVAVSPGAAYCRTAKLTQAR